MKAGCEELFAAARLRMVVSPLREVLDMDLFQRAFSMPTVFFYPLPWIDAHKMALLFRDKVFSMPIHEGKISEDLAKKACSKNRLN